MASNITLSAGVRQNLLSLQNTAALMSADAEPSRDRQEGQLGARQSGQLLHLAVAQQPRQRPQLAARLDRSGAEDARSGRQGHHLADQAGRIREVDRQAGASGSAARPPSPTRAISVDSATRSTKRSAPTGDGTRAHGGDAGDAYSFTINVNGAGARTVNYTSDAVPTYAEILAGLQSPTSTASGDGAASRPATSTGCQRRRRRHHGVNADVDADVDLVDRAATTGAGLTERHLQLDQPARQHPAAVRRSTLTVAVNGGANQVDHVRHRRRPGLHARRVEHRARQPHRRHRVGVERQRARRSRSRRPPSQNSLTRHRLDAASTDGARHHATARPTARPRSRPPNATRTSCRRTTTTLLTQIDALAGDASYNGINLLNGDDLKVVFNETGTSSLTISGVTFNSAGLGLTRSAAPASSPTPTSTRRSPRSTPR